MSNEKTNIEHLRDIINAEMFNKEEALEFLEAIEKEKTALEKQVDDDFDIEEPPVLNTIDCGIGEIEWIADNLQLELLMENLEERIKEHGPFKTMRMLQVPLPTN